MYIQRELDIKAQLKQKSFFLFGPRQTGKSSLIRHALPDCRVFNLLDNDTYLRLSRAPRTLREICIAAKDRTVVIDEIQKLPVLLDEVHRMIEEDQIHFLLTGSSARKLRRGGINLLGGRARIKHLLPFTYRELGNHFDLLKALNNGLLPSLFFSESPKEDLEAYVGTYLKEEIAAEGLTRNIPAFSRFLEVAALCNGRLLNYAKVSNDAQIARTTIHEYFEILKDTLLAYEVPAWKHTKKRKPISTSKIYLFDPGVARFLQNRGPAQAGSPEFGEAFENWIFHELKAYAEYRGQGAVSYWRSQSGFEVDFILGDSLAIEVKASRTVGSGDLKTLKALSEEGSLKHYILVCLEDNERTVGNIHVLPWRLFLDRLWAGEWGT